jgi:hypothetical protein
MYIQCCTVVSDHHAWVFCHQVSATITYTEAITSKETLFPLCYMLDPKLFLQPHTVHNKELPFLVELHA